MFKKGVMKDPTDAKRLESWLAVVKAYQACSQRYEEMLAEFGLTVVQFELLTVILKLDNRATPKQLANHLLVTKGNITGLLGRLQSKGMVVFEPNPTDGRTYWCSVAIDTVPIVRSAGQAAKAFVREQLSVFDDEAINKTTLWMTQMTHQLQRMNPHAIAAPFLLEKMLFKAKPN